MAYDGGGGVAIDVAPFSIISPCPIATMQRPFAKIVCKSHVPPLPYVRVYLYACICILKYTPPLLAWVPLTTTALCRQLFAG